MERYIRWALIILAGVLLVLLIFFMVQYRAIRQQQDMTARALRWSMILEHHAPLAASEASIIRSWMTFDYVDKLFGLPPDYLRTNLAITSPYYPRLTIASYVKTENLNTTTFLSEVESAVQHHAAPSSTVATTTQV